MDPQTQSIESHSEFLDSVKKIFNMYLCGEREKEERGNKYAKVLTIVMHLSGGVHCFILSAFWLALQFLIIKIGGLQSISVTLSAGFCLSSMFISEEVNVGLNQELAAHEFSKLVCTKDQNPPELIQKRLGWAHSSKQMQTWPCLQSSG